MLLLDAVNKVLGRLGEHPVDHLDFKNPSVSKILQAIEDVNNELQAQGWWFNKFKVTLTPRPNGQIAMPDNILRWQWESHPSFFQRGFLVDGTRGSEYWKEGSRVDGVVTHLVDFESLPFSFANWVTAKAVASAYVDDYGFEQVIQYFEMQASRSESLVVEENLNYLRHSTKNSKAYRRLRGNMLL